MNDYPSVWKEYVKQEVTKQMKNFHDEYSKEIPQLEKMVSIKKDLLDSLYRIIREYRYNYTWLSSDEPIFKELEKVMDSK